MQICNLLLLLLLCWVATLTQGASIAAPGPGSQYCLQQCLINRRRIMAAAKRYYKARYETRLLLFKLKIHRQRLAERRLRYGAYLQRMRFKYQGRIQKRFIRFSRKVQKSKNRLGKRLRSLTKQFQRKVMRKLSMKSDLSTRRAKLIQKAFFPKGVMSTRAARTARRSVDQRSSTGTSFISTHRHATSRLITRTTFQRRRRTQIQSVLLDPKRIRKMIKIRARKTIGEEENMLIRMYDDLAREIYRTLVFRRRMFRIAHHRRVLARRINKLHARSRRVANRIALLRKRRQGMRRRLKLEKSLRPTTRRRLTMRMSGSLKRKEVLTRRQLRLKLRVARISARRHWMSHRIRILQKREKRQLRASAKRYAKLATSLARWKIYGPKRFNESSRVVSPKKDSSTIEPMDRATIRRIMRVIKDEHATLVHLVMESVVARRQYAGYKKHLAKLQRKIIELTKPPLRPRQFGIEPRQRLVKIATRLGLLQAKIASERKRRMRLSTVLFMHALKYRNLLVKYNLHEFLKPLNASTAIIIKFRGRIQRRENRIKRQVKQQKRLLRRIAERRRLSTRMSRRLIRRQSRRALRIQLKRVANRVVKRMKRIQKKIKLEARKVRVIKQLKLHIKQRRILLVHRSHRLSARRQHLKSRIATLEKKRSRLVSLVERLQLRKWTTRQKEHGKRLDVQLRKISARIKRAINRTGVYNSRIRRMKKRRIQLKIRLEKIAVKQRRVRQRFAANELRSRRRTRQLQQLVIRKQHFVKRVVKRKLISSRTIKRIAKQTSLLENLDNKLIANEELKLDSRTLGQKVIGVLPRVQIMAGLEKVLGKKLLIVSAAEVTAREILQSSRGVRAEKLEKLKTVQLGLKEQLSILKNKFENAKPALQRLVKQDKWKLQKAENKVTTLLNSKMAHVQNANQQIFNTQTKIYRTEYQELLPPNVESSKTSQEGDSGWSTVESDDTNQSGIRLHQ